MFQGLVSKVQGVGFRVNGFGFRVLGFRGLGFKMYGSGFRVQGSGSRVQCAVQDCLAHIWFRVSGFGVTLQGTCKWSWLTRGPSAERPPSVLVENFRGDSWFGRVFQG